MTKITTKNNPAEYLRARAADWQSLLGRDDALWLMALIGICSGLLTGIIVVAFRFTFEGPLELLIPNTHTEGFESLPRWAHFALPTTGGILIGVALHYWTKGNITTGVAHTVHGANNLHGKLPWQNVVVQFFAGAAALGTGQSLGREGPAVHLGAGVSTIVGQRFGLPNNSLRVLIGCGTAAAIAASFNTPIAGIIFAMEVVLFEYTIMGFMPIMLAAVSGTVISRIFYGDAPAISMQASHHINLIELFFIGGLAIVASAVSATFVWLTKFWLRQSFRPIWLRLSTAGFITGCLALIAPQILGAGYDTMTDLLANSNATLFILVIIVAKLIATSASAGMGMPAGVIGPSLFIGACLGALMAELGQLTAPGMIGSSSLYIMLGMTAMMAATLNAPLAALLALVELTYSPGVIFPGLLVISLTNICHRSLFKQPSIVSAILTSNGINLATDPVSLALQSRSARHLMTPDVLFTNADSAAHSAIPDSNEKIKWVVTQHNDEWFAIKQDQLTDFINDEANNESGPINELSSKSPAVLLDEKATLKQAWTALNKHNVNVLIINYYSYGNTQPKYGVLTRTTIERNVWQH